jgi:hypothetical protein
LASGGFAQQENFGGGVRQPSLDNVGFGGCHFYGEGWAEVRWCPHRCFYVAAGGIFQVFGSCVVRHFCGTFVRNPACLRQCVNVQRPNLFEINTVPGRMCLAVTSFKGLS